MAKKLTTEEFIKRARAVHGDKYGYDEVVYVNNKSKVSIKCLTHGLFTQSPASHLNGSKCPECSVETVSYSRKLGSNKFKSLAAAVHGGKYCYDNVSYVNTKTKVKILCPKHGEFEQTPNSHVYNRSGCPKCFVYRSSEFRTVSISDIEERLLIVHNNKYTYDFTDYVNTKGRITAACSKHGEFSTSVSNHLYSLTGCPKCATVISKGHAEVGAFLESILNG